MLQASSSSVFFKRLLAGQTLIEVVVAIALCSIILVAVTKLIVASFTNTVFSESQVNASNLSQDAMAYVGSLQQSDLATFNTYSGSYCFGRDNTGRDESLSPLSSCFTGTSPSTPNVGINPANPIYVRTVKIIPNSSSCTNTTEVDATTYWNDSTCRSNKYCHNSTLTTCMNSQTYPFTPTPTIPPLICGSTCTTNSDCTNSLCPVCVTALSRRCGYQESYVCPITGVVATNIGGGNVCPALPPGCSTVSGCLVTCDPPSCRAF